LHLCINKRNPILKSYFRGNPAIIKSIEERQPTTNENCKKEELDEFHWNKNTPCADTMSR
jgi:hypothetical protein